MSRARLAPAAAPAAVRRRAAARGARRYCMVTSARGPSDGDIAHFASAARAIRAELPGTGVLVLSQYLEEAYAMELLGESAEGVGYILKDRVADIERFVDSVRRVADGGSALDPEVVSQMLGRRRASDPLAGLTARERDVLALMAEGRSNAAIADELVVTERAVEKHVTSIFGKLGLAATPQDHRRVLAVLTYLRA
jgi:DNA-binding NarL/FixJ family response regulator